MYFETPINGICVSTGSYSERIADRKYHIYGIAEDEILISSDRMYGESSLTNFIALTNALHYAFSNGHPAVYTDCYVSIRNVNEQSFDNIPANSPAHARTQLRAERAVEWLKTLTFRKNDGGIADQEGKEVLLKRWNYAYHGEIPVNKHIKDVYF